MREFGIEEFLFIIIIILSITFVMGTILNLLGIIDLGLDVFPFRPWH